MKWKKCLIGMMCACSVFVSSFLFGFESRASSVSDSFAYDIPSEYIFNVPYARPSLTGNSGYFNLMTTYTDSSGKVYHSMDTYVWSIGNLSTTGADASNASGSLEFHSNYFRFYPEIGGNGGRCVFSVIHQDGQFEVLECFGVTDSSYYEFNYSSAFPSLSIYIEGIQYYGNYSNVYFGSGIKFPNNDGFVVNYSDTAQYINALNDIILSLGSLEVSNQAIFDQLFEGNSSLRKIWKNQDDLEIWLADALALIDKENKDQNAELDRIYAELQSIHEDLLNMRGEESTEELPSEDVGGYLEKEDELIQDTSEYEDDINFSVDMNSNSVVWSIIERFLNANSKVFGTFVGILSLGIVALILGR